MTGRPTSQRARRAIRPAPSSSHSTRPFPSEFAVVSTGWTASLRTTTAQRDTARRILGALGDELQVEDGDEEWIRAAARLSYSINRRNLVELSYVLADVASDIRSEYSRNRASMGWVYRF